MQTMASSAVLHCRLPTRPASKLHHCQTFVSALTKDGSGGGGGMVDKNMTVLRKRINEIKMSERNSEPPTGWMEWEKNYTTYDSDICELVGVFQTLLMNTRPGVAIGLLALLLFSIPTSLFFISSQLLQSMAYYLMPGLIHF